LRSRIFGGNLEFNTEYFEWKYERNPYLKEPHFYVAFHDEEVVAMRGFYGSRWQVEQESESLVIPIGGDLAVDLDHRRQKLASRMLTYITKNMESKGYPYLMNLSANPSSRRLQIRSGYPRVAPFRTFQLGNPRTTLYSSGYQRAKRILFGDRSTATFRRFDRWTAKTKGSIIGASEPRIYEMGELGLRCGDKSRIHLIRDATFYRWRFMNPASDYRFIFYEGSRSLEGFLVLQSAKVGGWTTIIDWETSTPAMWTKLINAAVKSNPKCLRITSTMFTEGQVQPLQNLGFEPLVEPGNTDIPDPGMLLHLSSGNDVDGPRFDGLRVLDANSWDIRIIASDRF
jgi:GNAT superfamily N-acetyltransferase